MESHYYREEALSYAYLAELFTSAGSEVISL